MLRIEKLTVRYGGNVALDGVSLDIRAGTIACLLGANGAGKSTLMNTVAGLIPPSGGHIEIEKTSVAGWSAERLVKHGVTLVPEGRQLFGDLTVEENIRLGGYTRRDSLEHDFSETIRLFPKLSDRRQQLCKTLSGGEQQMVAIGRALMAKPRLLLLDEPSLGLAPLLVREVMQLVQEVHRRGVTVFLVEQNARLALSIAHDAFVLENGHIIKAAPAEQLIRDESLTAAYLGKQ